MIPKGPEILVFSHLGVIDKALDPIHCDRGLDKILPG